MSALIRVAGASVLAAITLSGTAAAPVVAASSSTSAPAGRLVLVQALPQQDLDIAIDGRVVERGTTTGAVLGPIPVAPGAHQVEFSHGTTRLVTTVDVAPGSSSDVVVHLPAQVDGSPVVNTYRTPMGPIPPGKARVLIAHTATVAPADVRVDGAVVFHDIANGEYATAEVAAGAHSVALLPAGQDSPPILGPLRVSLEAGTVTMVYAVGNPRTHSMNVIVHKTGLGSNGAVAPASIDTGTAGLAADLPVRPFSVTPTSSGATAATSPSLRPMATTMVAVLVGLAMVLTARRGSGRRPLRRR
ncbi:DUF4397 domain-containing protein [Nocardioides cynanchi]|uniref:DUF4397 domain-containing protein n=1 Tax=Nocardioides cynanchi TaxID=2558918 RepID=UPI0017854A4E|nr:DUF4397 domain-containing protein [Nocardioides cynanchi]